MSSESDTSYYRIYPQKVIKPVVHYEKTPVRAEGSGNEIKQGQTNLPSGGKSLPKEKPIKLHNIESLWRSGNYDQDGAPFKQHRLTNLKEIKQFYSYPGEVPLSVELPPWNVDDTITLNTEEGIHKQWSQFVKKTGKH